jgi:hypothetical protein
MVNGTVQNANDLSITAESAEYAEFKDGFNCCLDFSGASAFSVCSAVNFILSEQYYLLQLYTSSNVRVHE